MVPLGDGESYNIPAYDMDATHYIREDLDWWKSKVEKAGFKAVFATYDLGPFKENWKFEEKGNGLLIARKRK